MSHPLRALVCAAFATALVACTPPATTATPEVEGPIAGTINGQPVQVALIDAYAKARFQKSAAELDETQLLQSREDIVRLFALSQAARDEGLDKDPTVAMQSMQALAQILIRNKVEGDALSTETLQARYEALLNTGEARELKARHILLKTEDEARAVIKELDGGGNFEELAKAKSTGPSATNGGDLGWFGAGSMVEPFWKGALALEAGNYTKDPVQTRFGYHVILLEQTRDRPFAQAEEQLKATMQREMVENYVKSLTDTATVSWNTGS